MTCTAGRSLTMILLQLIVAATVRANGHFVALRSVHECLTDLRVLHDVLFVCVHVDEGNLDVFVVSSIGIVVRTRREHQGTGLVVRDGPGLSSAVVGADRHCACVQNERM